MWDWSRPLADNFVTFCNANNLGLSFTSVYDPDTLAFLKLELSHTDNAIQAKNCTKPTAGNSYLHFCSYHHPRWICNIPKSQFCHLKHNFTRLEDYNEQSNLFKQKFSERATQPL